MNEHSVKIIVLVGKQCTSVSHLCLDVTVTITSRTFESEQTNLLAVFKALNYRLQFSLPFPAILTATTADFAFFVELES